MLPVALVVMISIFSSESLTYNGFSFSPSGFSFVAYESLFKTGSQLIDSYIVTIAMMAVFTFLGMSVMAALAFVLAHQRFSGKKSYTIMLFITMIFSGGLTSSYIINVNYLHLYDSFWILVLPGLVNAFNVIVLRTFISTEMFDDAAIDGATDFTVYFRIVIPLSKAGLATIALFLMVNKWNECFNGMLYIDNAKLVPLQTMLTCIQQKIDFIKNNSPLASTSDGMRMLDSMPTEQTRMAIVVIATLPTMCAYPFFQRYFIQDMTIGSVMG